MHREFIFHAAEREAVGVVWDPPRGETSRGCVLVCHGGSGHKLAPDIVATAETVADRCAAHVVAIDGPVHGQNSPYPDDRDRVIEDFRRLWREGDGLVDRAVADWSGAIAAITGDDAVNTERLGWYGVSMGTAYGIPVLAATPRISSAILGMWSLEYPNSNRIRVDAPEVRCAVQFHIRTEDQLFPVADQTTLFDSLGAVPKKLLTYAGAHVAPGPDQLANACRFLNAYAFQPMEN